jgi:hypothetical protein
VGGRLGSSNFVGFGNFSKFFPIYTEIKTISKNYFSFLGFFPPIFLGFENVSKNFRIYLH